MPEQLKKIDFISVNLSRRDEIPLAALVETRGINDCLNKKPEGVKSEKFDKPYEGINELSAGTTSACVLRNLISD